MSLENLLYLLTIIVTVCISIRQIVKLLLQLEKSKAIKWLYKRLSEQAANIPSLFNSAKTAWDKHLAILGDPSPRQTKVAGWINILCNVLFAAIMNIYAGIFLLLAALACLSDEPSLIKVCVGIGCAVLLFVVGRFFRADARHIAKQNNFNISMNR